ncbi:MFS transporter [Allopusillimonas ginsengisoli]|uniref:MFS transporter n=1 Tax=Allopusillimonas ginsengisoli TaxID=453575 RepID=UPI00101F32AF|nr:MFS transporter [Allopusillimonas ginsengisoli]TEA79000.1 MFS transporter [Allopusillimonas ginsengisoli]
MSSPLSMVNARPETQTFSRWLVLLQAVACGLIAANIYYAQPLAGLISVELGLSAGATGLIVTLTQIGYGMGLLLIVPLGDLIENRLLTLVLLGVSALALLGAGLSTSPLPFLLSSLGIGVGAVAVQVLVPYAAHMAPEVMRGRVVGNVMSGLMLGIMLARPVSSFLTEIFSWHSVFFASAATMALLAGALALKLPTRVPRGQLHYGQLLASMGRLARHTPILRRRALYHAALFAAFSLFWTTTPLLLAGPIFELSQSGIALFALAGVAGAIAAPIAGRVADLGWTRPATALAMLAVAAGFLLTHIATPGSTWSLILLVLAAVVLDFGVAANMALGQREIFGLGAEFRARLNGLYMTTFFIGGAIGSALGGWAYAQNGWPLASWIGVALPVLALVYWSSERTSI